VLLVIVAAVTTRAIGGSGGPGVSNYYKQGYSAGQASQFSGADQPDTVEGNLNCTNWWNQDVNGTGPNGNVPGGQPIEDYDSGWVAACEHAPYGQSGIDVPGSDSGPNNPTDPYSASEGQ
jgi:hypothetical protein